MDPFSFAPKDPDPSLEYGRFRKIFVNFVSCVQPPPPKPRSAHPDPNKVNTYPQHFLPVLRIRRSHGSAALILLLITVTKADTKVNTEKM